MPVTTYTEDDLVDQFDEFEGDDDELSPEDKVAMSEATAAVQKVLGDQVTVAQIQEALWHYYYDVDKSVAYLRRTFISPPKPAPKKAEPAPKKPEPAPKKPEPAPKKPEGKSGEFSFSDALGLFVRAGREPDPGDVLREFDDMPWMNVPRHRLATMEPPPWRGGLLGGGSEPKMSKLQALAAARKKKTETAQAENGLKRLSISDAEPSKRQKNWSRPPLEEQPPQSPRVPPSQTPPARAPPVQTPDGQASGAPPDPPKAAMPTASQSQPPLQMQPVPQPSAFARTLFGPPARSTRPEMFAMPYASALSAEAFDQPSPDDIVLAAQAKGSLARQSNELI
ncbi:hypothetical protein JDV02_004576 [Purpureocillium takamizusanense]|uniref:HBS1-like protein N-terminal domain-containing protein n=1 Tax=Purpureocillium takamizusanense TaxID=2060973 RepID=A0A9Q8QEU9_9HYPO|nr:uncharacterized protein JDV02_004576 [Purpureocillium takamizusanense]UNI18300.1 hypothetical protein JDV02_004576 [Purpureocillium takamizusanense]